MKKLFVPFLCLLGACGDHAENQKETTDKVLEVATEVSTNVADTVCFINTDGLQQQDTTAVRLVINNDKVEGKILWMPHEKDGRFGNLIGSRAGDVINANWVYEQEGMKDSVAVAFKREGNRLWQKRSAFDTKTGREYLPDTAQYSIEYTKVDCSGMPRLNF